MTQPATPRPKRSADPAARRRAAAALEALPAPDRNIVLMAKADGLTDFEIAAVMDLPPNQVSNRRRAALATLKAAIAAPDACG